MITRRQFAESTPWLAAIPLRQCTRGDDDGKPLSGEELALLPRAGSSDTVRLLLLTQRPAIALVLDHLMQGNTAQLADVAFVSELKTWIWPEGRKVYFRGVTKQLGWVFAA